MSGLGPIHFVTRVTHHLARVPLGQRTWRHPYHIVSLHHVEGGSLRLGDEHHAVAGPFLCLLPAGDLDDNGMHGHNQAWWCAFSGSDVRPAVGGAQLTSAGSRVVLPRAHTIGATIARRAETLFRELRAALAADGVGGRLTAQARLGDLLALWVASGMDAAVDHLARFQTLIEQHACDPDCALDDLARQVGRHSDALTAAFRRRYGCTPVAFRTRVRLQRARDLLAGSAGGDAAGIAGIAVACGFADPGYFSRVFRRHVGCTPGEWARRFGSADG